MVFCFAAYHIRMMNIEIASWIYVLIAMARTLFRLEPELGAYVGVAEKEILFCHARIM